MNVAYENMSQAVGDDPLDMASRFATRMKTMWMRSYPFAGLGRDVSIHHSCDIERTEAHEIQVGDDVYLAPKVWLKVLPGGTSDGPKITIGKGCAIGRRSTISAMNQIALDSDVLLAPSVLIMDHSEAARAEGPDSVPRSGRIVIERNCWLGHGAVILCERGEIILGRNSIVGANAVVTQSFPAFSIVAGNPAKLIKTYDLQLGAWVKVKRQT